MNSSSPLTLLTTYNQSNQSIPYQGLELSDVREQLEHLDDVEDWITVALPPQPDNETYLQNIHEVLNKLAEPEQTHLYFGDWKNEEIRTWREEQFSEFGYRCHFPIWEASLHKLLPMLLFHPVTVRISWVQPEYQKYIRVGEPYNQRLVTTLPDEIDPMGENGEFHTRLEFPTYPEDPQRQPIL
jgi:diphthamide synthase (EF-2-diphthine--ammonia ligase)